MMQSDFYPSLPRRRKSTMPRWHGIKSRIPAFAGMTFMMANFMLITSSSAHAEPKVIVSIKPIHSLVALVMQGVGTPDLIISGTGSPHTYSLKPSDAEKLEKADVIFWVGHELETFLEKPIESLGSKAKSISLFDQPGLIKLAPREGNGFDPDVHEGEEAGHDHEEADAHIWLDPANAKLMLKSIAEALAQIDLPNAATYDKNATAAMADIDKLDAELAPQLSPLKGKGFIVFHDAYQYFEKHYGLQAAGAISINPENPPGAAGLLTLKQRIADGKATCVFAEPQFDNKLVNLIIEGTTAKSATLDPLGTALDAGPEHYGQLMRDLAKSLVNCLG